MKLSTSLLSLAATSATAALSTYDAGNGLTYAVSIPDATAQSGSGDFYFQMSGPSTNSWVALGIGSSMPGSSIFVMYADGTGNVTVSPRLGVGFREPEPNPDAQVTLLEGTGITNGMMVANVKCTNCATWSSGSIDFTSSSQSFIHANRMGAPLDTTNTDAELVQHQQNGQPFTFDLVQATGGSVTANPFALPGTNTTTPVVTGPGSTSGSSGSAEGESSFDPDGFDMLQRAHGIIMGLTVVILIPLGALAMRLFPVPWWLHGAVQTLFLVLFTAGWAVGYVAAGQISIRFSGPGFTHTVFGTVIFALFWVQPFLGYAHHLMYRKTQARTPAGHAHVWWGRAVMLLAIVNGGLGLQLADNTRGGEIAYGVLAGVVGVVYIAGAVFGEMRGARRAKSSSAAGPEMSGKR